MTRKLKFIFVFLLLTFSVNAQTKKSILFVCEHGAARSAIAAAYFNKIAKERGLNYEAQFRGTDPQDSLTAGTKLGLTKDGLVILKMKPLVVSNDDVSRAEGTITFDCKLPNLARPKTLARWDGIPPISENYDIARSQIVVRVKELVEQLLKK